MEEAAGLIALTAASVEDDEIDDGVAGKLAASDDSAGGGSRGGGSDIAGGGSTAEVGGGNSNRKGDWWKSRRPSSSRKPTEPLSPPLASKNPPGSGKVDGIWEENGGGIAAADASISSSRFSTIIASPTSGIQREKTEIFLLHSHSGRGQKKKPPAIAGWRGVRELMAASNRDASLANMPVGAFICSCGGYGSTDVQLSTVLTSCGGKRERPFTDKPSPVVPCVWTRREVLEFKSVVELRWQVNASHWISRIRLGAHLGWSTTYGKVKCEYQGRSITGRRRRRVQRQAVRYGRDLEGVKELNHRLHDPNLHLHALDVFRGLPHQPFELQGFTICHQLLEQSKPPLEASRSSVFRAHVDNPLDRLCFHCRRARLIEATLPSGHLQLSAAMDQTILLLL
ncbi:hypothetical protein MUK42_25937 [Musa troglodytarum]|uniref:Uncharacterized protein n=1 Tax=Musa troglodytarum TaxID=320322 RepID=A0A9E7F730_9LILI|nr:hypothetical protein MUK42_25937 [Musa troglodytarum]